MADQTTMGFVLLPVFKLNRRMATECRPCASARRFERTRVNVRAEPRDLEKLKRITEEQWKDRLNPTEFHVLIERQTEEEGSGKFVNFDEVGVYSCKICNQQLFSSDDKIPSERGWASFDRPAQRGAIDERFDFSSGAFRIECMCGHCRAHLGHSYPDQTDTGVRFSINSAALLFTADDDQDL
mmetsp:Transcript_4234/g.12750  ORF Transcript_4234/g.12750 Transcript_4234/m.12750 type:complete len:183 (-) Transcript_4234:2659-3207(-)